MLMHQFSKLGNFSILQKVFGTIAELFYKMFKLMLIFKI